MQDKEVWINKHYPMIKERLLVFEDKSKTNTILDYCNRYNIDLKDAVFVDAVFVDDIIPFLRETERKVLDHFTLAAFLMEILRVLAKLIFISKISA